MRTAGLRGIVVRAGCLLAATTLVAALAPTLASAAPLRGRLDPTFGKGGEALFGLGQSVANSSYDAMVREPDGSILVAGKTETVQGKYIEGAGILQRRLPNGALDPSFQEAVAGSEVTALALEPDGDVLYSTAGEFSGALRRLGPTGAADTAYGKNGVVGLSVAPAFIAIDSQGRTIVAGSAGVGGNCHDCLPSPVPAVERLLPNGSVDMSFGQDGRMLMGAPAGTEAAYGPVTGLVVESDGSMLVASEKAVYGLTAAGVPNSDFGKEGTIVVAGAQAMTQTAGGDVVVVDSSASYCCSQRGAFVIDAFRVDGSLDPAWGTNGVTTIQVAAVDSPSVLAATPDGGVLLGGETAPINEATGCSPCEWSPYVARLTASGAVDPGFSSQLAEVPKPFPKADVDSGYSSLISSIALDPGGRVLLAGTTEGVELASVTALTADGALDRTFGTSGLAADPQPLPGSLEMTGFAAGPGGRLVATYRNSAGAYAESSGTVAWDRSGARIAGLGGETDLTYSKAANALQSDRMGRLYRYEERSDSVLRLAKNGTDRDPTYGAEGRAYLPKHFAAKAMVVRGDGTALVVGKLAGREPMALFELTPAGRPDRAFGDKGLALVPWKKGERAVVLAATFDRRGRIVLFGSYGRQTPLARLLPDGHLDKSFGHGGRVNYRPLIETDVTTLTVGPEGRIYLAASGRNGGETTIVRFRENGARDRSFGKGGIVQFEASQPVLRFIPGRRQLVLVSGKGEFHDSGFAMRAFRPDGRLDRSFAHGGIFRGDSGPTKGFGPINVIGQPNGEIVVAGTHHPREYGEELELLRFR